ncbi:MAG: orotidine-5'-phosphate decarboxylase [Saprospiraceae bacterium]
MSDFIWDKSSLNKAIHTLESCLCVGLDADLLKMPYFVEKSPAGMLFFNKEIIDHTFPYAVSYKLNAAFYEVLGCEGWKVMAETISYIKSKHRFVILDAKRGDIGNTADKYAHSAFEILEADGVTVAPYMGKDSVTPFLSHKNKWAILLALTSNPGANDFQLQKLANGKFLYEEVIHQAIQWGNPDQLMFVTGATRPDYLVSIRKLIPDYFLLIPGIGAQGGDLTSVMKAALTIEGDILINASRSIIYASSDADFGLASAEAAKLIQVEMAQFIEKI